MVEYQMSLEDQVRKHYPSARRISDLREYVIELIASKCGVTRENTLLATCTCVDDILMTKDFAGKFSGPFFLGGLAGLPFGGATGISAFLHHVPDHGMGLLIHGPHIGVTADGAIGCVARFGQSAPSACCGSLMSALKDLRSQSLPAPPTLDWDNHDLEQAILVHFLKSEREKILSSECPEREITDVVYELGQRMLRRLLDRPVHGLRIASLGGVMINTPPDEEDWFDLRDLHFIGC